MLEKEIQSKIVQWCRKQPDIWIVKYQAGVYGITGVPDLLLCVKGMFIGLEVKGPSGKPTEAQMLQRAKILKSGGICEVVRSLDEAIEVIGRAM